jgi:hypothetical protein
MSRPAGRRRALAPPRREDLEERDPLGRMALYSDVEPDTDYANDRLVLECSSCGRQTAVSPLGLVRAALPFSLHLPSIRRYPSYMRCPACGRLAWLRVHARI